MHKSIDTFCPARIQEHKEVFASKVYADERGIQVAIPLMPSFKV